MNTQSHGGPLPDRRPIDEGVIACGARHRPDTGPAGRPKAVRRRSVLRFMLASILVPTFSECVLSQERPPSPPAHKVVLFDRVRADFRFALVVPNDWDAGMPKVGILPFAQDPQLDWFGVVRSPGDRVLGEVRYLVRKPQVDARGVFIDLAQRRYRMDLHEARLVAGDAERGEYLFSYVAEDGRNGLEHLWIGETLAVSLFYTSPDDLPGAERTSVVDSIRESDVRFE